VSLLGRTWALHDLENVENFVVKVLDDTLRARGAYLQRHEYEDAVSFLLGAAWTLSEQWDPGRGVSFSSFAYRTLRLRVVDWYRAEFGRSKWQFANGTHVRERPAVLSIDDPDGNPLVDTLRTRAGDPTDDRDPDLERVLAGGDRQVARDLELLGVEPPKRAA
jgi:DNA-directed RNA polymerase specialized sigma24 family protein